MEWEKVKDFYDSCTATNFGKVSCILLVLGLGISGWYVDKRGESRRYFKCNTTQANKDFLEAECFDKYSQDYVDRFPPVAFLAFYLFLLVVMVVYTVFALRHVMALREYKTDLSKLPQQIKGKMEASFSVFAFFVTQITLRILALAVFIGLQWTLRPRNFPPTYKCHLKTPVYCKDDFYKQNAILNYVSSGINAAIVISSVVELIQVLIKCCSSRRLNNFEFNCFLLHIIKPPGVSTEFSSMEAYRDRLVHQYLGAMSQVNIKPWDPEDTIHINNVYTRLQWVQQKKTVKGWEQNALKDYCDLFAQSSEHHENPKRLLVQGKAGIGKSTFSSKLAMDWAQGKNEVLKRFELLIVLRLREVYFVKTLAEALNKCLGFEQSEAEEIIQYMGDNSDKVLLLLDGLDEYDITQSNEVLEVIHGPRLPGCLVVVTARPWMGEKIGKHMHAQFEIMGFNKEDITTYAARHFNTEAEIDSFVEYLIHNGLLPLAQIPLLLLFLCLLWKERKEEGLPSSRAELYREIIQCIIHHHNAKSSAASSDALDENAELLNRMGKIALDALKRNSLIFSYQDLAQDEQSSQILSLGLLSISKAPTRNPKVMISFLHKSVQEFLAALYITALMQSQEKEFEVRNIMDDLQLTFEYSLFIKCQLWYSENVVCFLCGLSDTGCVQVLNKLCHKRESDEIKKHLPQEFSDSPSIELYSFHKLCIEHCMSRNNRMEEVVTALVNCLKGFIAVSQSKHILNFVVSLLIEGKWKGLVVTKTKFDDLQTCAFKTLEIQLKQPGSNEHSPCADRFLQQLDVFGKEVTLWIQKDDDYTFSLLQYDINSQGCFDFCVEIDLQNDWDMDPESEEDTELIMLDIITMYPEGLCRLEDDYFGRDTITRVPFERLLRLRELRIVDQLLTAEIVHKLSVALPSMVHMQVIELKSRPDIEDGNMKKITHQLQHVTQLRKLDLRKTGMGSTSGRALVESLQHTILLEMLDLSYNPLGDNWLEGLSQHLHEIPHLRILKLRCTNMTVIGARALSGGFHCFPQLEVLDLSDNLLGDGVSSVIQNLVGTPHLQKLYLSVKRVTMSDAAANSLALPRLHQLKYLDLSNNHLCDAAVQAFAVSLCNVPQLETLKLSHAQMTGEGLMALACSLHHTPKLTDLNLSFNSFITDSEAWKKLAAELHLIPREKYQYLRLGLSGCTITGPALAELVALSHVHIWHPGVLSTYDSSGGDDNE